MQGKVIPDFRGIAKAVADTRPIKELLLIFLPAHVGLRFRSGRPQVRLSLSIWTLHLGIDTARAPKEMWGFAPLAFIEIWRCDAFPTFEAHIEHPRDFQMFGLNLTPLKHSSHRLLGSPPYSCCQRRQRSRTAAVER